MKTIENDLKSLITFASEQVEEIFYHIGMVAPMYHAIKENGEILVFMMPDVSKDEAVDIVRFILDANRVESYVFIGEAWMLHTLDVPVDVTGLSRHPDSREAVMFSAENTRGEALTASRYILRPEHGRATLTPLKFNKSVGHSEGRMVGLLKRRKK